MSRTLEIVLIREIFRTQKEREDAKKAWWKLGTSKGREKGPNNYAWMCVGADWIFAIHMIKKKEAWEEKQEEKKPKKRRLKISSLDLDLDLEGKEQGQGFWGLQWWRGSEFQLISPQKFSATRFLYKDFFSTYLKSLFYPDFLFPSLGMWLMVSQSCSFFLLKPHPLSPGMQYFLKITFFFFKFWW